ncbi:MAG: bifunctional proline dehydrogenase/L-glutamate gamma-semialdehyde dehydrogenase PutA [Alphaproteobacteria bacterium]|nr:bifunctional proline dehydrogenase/L-glutamate gamma-semialdehyde dehydrogenase PutA [Alphaproteobacteria bacterium]
MKTTTAKHTPAPAPQPSISDISQLAFQDEAACVKHLLDATEPLAALEGEIMRRAERYAGAIRQAGTGHGMEAFLHTYSLSTREGVALMCLAEALLRIPDSKTADQLIADTFEGRDFRTHAKDSESWLVSASSWGLLLAGSVVDFGDDTSRGITATLKGLVGKVSEPVVRTALRQAMKMIGGQFVLGESIEAGIANGSGWAKKGYRFSYDILGEGARSDLQSQHYIQAYHHAIAKVGAGASEETLLSNPGISVKLSALHPRYSLNQRGRVLSELKPRLKEILLLAKKHHIAVSIDAEEANRLDIEMILFEELLAEPELAGWNGVGFVLQAYQKRAFHVIDFLAQLARKHGRVIPLRLVKGAYWDSEIKHAQVMGLPGYPVFTKKPHTDLSYLACADKILSHASLFYPQFATHNARTIASIQVLAGRYKLAPSQFEFQRLHGMGEKLHDMIVEDGYASRIYAPIGEHKDLLAYLIRRLLENGANTSFVNLLMDKDLPLAELLADPRVTSNQQSSTSLLPLPLSIYPDRKNSSGIDTGYLHLREPLERELARQCDIVQRLGRPADHSAKAAEEAITSALSGFDLWSQTSVDARAQMLEKAADLLEEKRDELLALLIHEAGKTISDAVSEVREAADFCRYYALHARKLIGTEERLSGPTGESNCLSLHPRGVFIAISPWNFPLAIFIGQVVAALATGNSVVAKPAEQTPIIAREAVKILYQAGIPKEALQLAYGDGKIGAALVADPRISGVVFTGSVEVAQIINRALAAKSGAIVPLIAETGGMNAMVVDSSALLEAAVDDIVLSAFGSAGQRCSALRVLYVQEEIAESLLALLAGAMAELNVGTPSQFAADIGPVIDAEAKRMLEAHIERMKREAKLVAASTPSDDAGHFVTPHAFEISSMRVLEKEIFGPVLHVVRFKGSELKTIARDINESGYGLTFGLHSRIDDHIQFFTRAIRAGNLYINRSMTGAVVGVQPFGGEGLSGTGPKAGGPHYLHKFLTERTMTINVAAIGGNLELLMKK